MSCLASGTPLHHYMRSLQRQTDPGNPGSKGGVRRFPMFTVPLKVLMKMTKVEAHEVLKERGELVEFKQSMGQAAFVSHQWVSVHHPDPEFKQMRVLQEALSHVLDGLTYIPLDSNSETAATGAKPLHVKELRSKPLFFWYDYFSCPQLQINRQHLLHAIDSISEYVADSRLFLALCPTVVDPDGSRVLTRKTWLQRGWCRMEKVCRELSDKESWIMIKSSRVIELKIVGGVAEQVSVGEGSFSIDDDRTKITPVILRAVRRKLLLLLERQDLVGYRVLLNQQPVLLRGLSQDYVTVLPNLHTDRELELTDTLLAVAKFLHENGFKGVSDRDRDGWSPIHYAALRGDPRLVRGLLESRADPNRVTKKASRRLVLPLWTPPLAICCAYKHHEAARLLLSARACATAQSLASPMYCAAAADDPEGVRALLDARCNIYEQNLVKVTAVEAAAIYGSLAALQELQAQSAQSQRKLDTKHSLHMAMLHDGSAEIAKKLVDLGADLNDQSFDWCKRTPLVRLLCAMSQLQHRMGNVTQFSRQVYHAEGATPLMFALLGSHYEGAEVLVAAGARLDLRNSRGWTAADFVRGQLLPDFLSRALTGAGVGAVGVPCGVPCRVSQPEPERLDDGEGSDGYVEVYF
ncbi:mask [Symbiodinium sp. CCMP2456]|nr:mask [Symbiodinium sp. CCMP2456]